MMIPIFIIFYNFYLFVNFARPFSQYLGNFNHFIAKKSLTKSLAKSIPQQLLFFLSIRFIY